MEFKRSHITHYNGKVTKKDGSVLKRTVRDRQKLKAYFEMSLKNKKLYIFMAGAKSVFYDENIKHQLLRISGRIGPALGNTIKKQLQP